MHSFFVSSTFKDMQGERDALHRIVMPRVREKAKACGESVEFVDLRWGISTAEMDSAAGAEKILSVCLNEVRQCKPCMIVMLGERYGWMPSPDILRQTSEDANFSMSSYEMSVTELEIQYSLWLAKGDLSQFVFCLRDPVPSNGLTDAQRRIFLSDSPEDKMRMQKLRNKIEQTPGATVLHYALSWNAAAGEISGYDEFAERLADTLENSLSGQWNSRRNLTWQERQREEDKLVIDAHLAAFVGRSRELQQIGQAIDSHRVVIVEGEGGCGKSALMSALMQQQRKKGRDAELFCCGNSAHCMSAEQLTELLRWRLAGTAYRENEPDRKQSYHLTAKAYSGKEIVLFIDAIDQLTPDQALFESQFLPPEFSDRIRFVISTTGAARVNPAALPTGSKGAASQVIHLAEPDEHDIREILNSRFRAEHKQISKNLANEMIKNPCCWSMLGMEIMVHRLVMLDQRDFREIAKLEQAMDGDSAISTYLIRLVREMPENLSDLIIDFFFTVCKYLDLEQYDRMLLPLYIIAMVQHGFSPYQFERFADRIRTDPVYEPIPEDSIWKHFWDPILFSRMCRYMGGLLLHRADGRIDFSHRLLREAVRGQKSCSSIAVLLRYFLFWEPQEDETKLETQAFLTRVAFQSAIEEGTTPDDFEMLDSYFHKQIRDIGNLENDDDPVKAAEGTRQMEILKRSILSDLSGHEANKHLDTYCRILENAIEEKAGPNHYSVWFFCSQLTALLEQQGEAGKNMAVMILCRCITALHRQRRRFLSGEDQFQGNWNLSNRKRFLFYHSRTLRLLAALHQDGKHGNMQVGTFHGCTIKSLLEDGLQLADQCHQEDPEYYLYTVRKASLHAHMAEAMTLSSIASGIRDIQPHIKSAIGYGMQALEIAANDTEKNKKTCCAYFLFVCTTCINALLDQYQKQTFLAPGQLKKILKLCSTCWDTVRIHMPVQQMSVEDVANFKNAWGKCLLQCGAKYKRQTQHYMQQSADIRCDFYFSVRQDISRQLKPADNDALASLATQIGILIMNGYMPTVMKENGFSRYTAARYLVEKDGGYVQAQSRSDFKNSWRQAQMLSIETFCHHKSDPHLCRQAGIRAIDLLTKLKKEVQQYSYSTIVPARWIDDMLKYVQSLLPERREL